MIRGYDEKKNCGLVAAVHDYLSSSKIRVTKGGCMDQALTKVGGSKHAMTVLTMLLLRSQKNLRKDW